jgi:hypothetical protein
MIEDAACGDGRGEETETKTIQDEGEEGNKQR